MNNHLKNWLDGVSQALVLYPEQDYLRPRRGDCQNDATALRGDVAKIANGLCDRFSKNDEVNSTLNPLKK